MGSKSSLFRETLQLVEILHIIIIIGIITPLRGKVIILVAFGIILTTKNS